MGSLLELLGMGATAKTRMDSAALEGQQVKRDREQKDLLAALAQQRQAAQDAEDSERNDLLNTLTRAQTTKMTAPDVPDAPKPQFVQDLGGFVTPGQPFQPVTGLPQQQEKPYEERQEQGGVAVYENGQFKRWKITPPRERAPNPMMEVTKEQQRFQREQGLSDDFRQEQGVKDASGIASAVATIRGALSNQTPQGDLAAIYALVKLYDPGSVVREGEISLTQSAASLPEQVRRLYDGWTSGKKLTPQMRADLASVANSIVTERQTQVNPILQRYGQRARQWGADSAAVAPNPLEGASIPVPGGAPDIFTPLIVPPPGGRP